MYAGFYLFLYKWIVQKISLTSSGNGQEEINALLESTYESICLPGGEYQRFSDEAKMALGFAIIKHTGKYVYNKAGKKVKQLLWRQGILEGRRRGWNAIRNPFRSVKNAIVSLKNAREVLRWIRWIKYLKPVFKLLNKLRLKLRTLHVTYHQRRQRKIMERARQRQWRILKKKERQVKASKIIQSTYRSYRQRQDCFQMVVLRQTINDMAARKIQFALRDMLENCRIKKLERERELELLEGKKSLSLRPGTKMKRLSSSDRERLQELRQENARHYKPASIDRRLLMRPDTKFQLIWQSLFVCCVLVELLLHGLNMRLSSKGDHTIKTKLQELIIPIPVTQHKQCPCLTHVRHDLSKWDRHVSKEKKCRGEPWYCHPLYYHSQIAYIGTMMFIMEQIRGLLALVTLLDVPMFFYTGNYEPDTSVLIPKPFFERWIFPGLFLQLLINPQMETISKLVFRGIQTILDIGPVRVLSWGISLFYPLLWVVFDFMENKVWISLVALLNRPTTPPAHQEGSKSGHNEDSVFLPRRRRSSIDPRLPCIFYPMGSSTVPDAIKVSLYRESLVSARLSEGITAQQSTELRMKRTSINPNGRNVGLSSRTKSLPKLRIE
jgi:hypothetical protein